jgi:hypothetical protein
MRCGDFDVRCGLLQERAAPRYPFGVRDQERAAARPYGEQIGFNRFLS